MTCLEGRKSLAYRIRPFLASGLANQNKQVQQNAVACTVCGPVVLRTVAHEDARR